VSDSAVNFFKKRRLARYVGGIWHFGTPFAEQVDVNNIWCVFSVLGHKKKIVAFVIAVAVGGGALVMCSAQTRPTEPRKTSRSPDLLSETDLNYSGGSIGTWDLFVKMMAAVLLVAALGVAAIYTSKKLLPKISNLPGKKIRIIETVHLGPRKAVHLLKIGNQQLLVGSTNEGITPLADVTDALTDLSSQETEDDNREI
jgi:flagellar biosynthetic protein FliO